MPLSDYFPELEGWTAVSPLENQNSNPSVPDSNSQVSAYLRTTQPLPLQYQQDTIKQYNRPGLSSYRIAPLAPNASAATQAASASTAKIVSQQIINSSGGKGGVASVGLAMPSQFVVTGSPVAGNGATGVLTAAWASEIPGTVLEVPPAGLGSFEGSTQSIASVATGNVLSVSMTPQTSSSLALLLQKGNSATGLVTPAGWTSINSVFVNSLVVSGTSPVAVSETLTGGTATASGALLVLFQGPAPTLSQSKVLSGSLSSTITFTSNNTAGNTLMVAVDAVGSSAGFAGITISDTNGNTYTNIASQAANGPSTSPNITVQNSLWVATNCAAGANTVSFDVRYTTGSSNTITVTIMEWGPLVTGSFFPSFGNLIGSQIPAINLGTGGPGGVAGILKVVNGGTGVSTSTGTTNVVLSNNPHLVGPTVDSGGLVITTGNLSIGSGKINENNNTFLQGNFGVPSIIAAADRTAQSAAITTTTIATPTNAGQYRLHWNAKVTTAATTSSTLGALTITYTDPDSVVQTITASAQSAAGVIETTDAGNTTTTVLLGMGLMLNVKASTAVQYAFAYTSTGGTAMQYNLHITLEGM